MEIINEKTSQVFTAEFYDQNGTSINPETAYYSLHDSPSGQAIIDTVFLPLPIPQVVEIEISREDNRILDSGKLEETRVLTVEFDYRNSKGELESGAPVEFTYNILNLPYVK